MEELSGSSFFFPGRAHLLTTSSSHAPHPSPGRKRQGSSVPLLLLSPQSCALRGPFRRWYPSLRSGTCALRGNCASCGKRQAAACVRVLRHAHFFCEKKQNNNGGDGAWQFTTWNRRSLAGEWVAPLWRRLPT